MSCYFLTRCYFFDPISVNPFFVEDGVTTSLVFASSKIRLCKLLTSCPKIHRPYVNQFDEVTFWNGFDYQMQQKYTVIDGVNPSADKRRFTSCQFLDDAAK